MLAAFLLVCLGSLADAAEIDASKLEHNRTKLNDTVERLKAEQSALQRSQDKASSILTDLDQFDQRLDQSMRVLEDIAKKITASEQTRKKMEEDIPKFKRETMKHQHALAGHLRLLYGLGEQGLVKIALRQDDQNQVQHGFRYFSYLLRARHDQIKDFRQSLTQLQEAITIHRASLEELKSLAAQLNEEQKKLKEKKNHRMALLERIHMDQELRQRKIEELKKAHVDLNSFIEKLEGDIAKTLLTRTTFGHIVEAKGRLSKPVTTTATTSELKPPGIFYTIPANTPVNAVYRGQVVYADWFRGYGLLLILDHGDHVFTLYGHNQKLLVAQGDWIDEGDKIALVGETGSLDGPGLYFEIRQKGLAGDPLEWFATGKR